MFAVTFPPGSLGGPDCWRCPGPFVLLVSHGRAHVLSAPGLIVGFAAAPVVLTWLDPEPADFGS